MRLTAIGLVAAALTCVMPAPISAQTPASPAAVTAEQPLSEGQLDALLAPIALYDDNLLAQVLMASTYPLEIVEADRWAKQNKSLKGDALRAALEKQSWDDSVKSLAAVPPVLDMMSSKLDWTQKLGDAVLAQQSDVMDSVQRLRTKAHARGKLTSTKQQTVTVAQEQSKQVIVIAPAEPDTVYVPYYDPSVVYGVWPYQAYPPFYWPAPGYIAGAAIATGIAWGAAWAVGRAIINGGFNWGNNNIVVNRNFNNVNVGNRIGNNTNWQHNPNHRQGVRYNNEAVRQKFANRTPGGANQRLDFRGRDGQQVLRPGENRPNIANRTPGGDRPNIANRTPGGDRPNVANRTPGGNRPNVANRTPNRASHVNRPGRDTGFSNIQPRNITNAQANRGRTSLAGRHGANSFAAAPRGGANFAGRGGANFAGRGGAGRGGRRSDVMLKHDIVLLGQLGSGVGFYRFRYNGSERAYVGVLAQEVQEVMPEAVVRDRDGWLRVFYDRLGVKFQTYEQWIASGARVPATSVFRVNTSILNTSVR